MYMKTLQKPGSSRARADDVKCGVFVAQASHARTDAKPAAASQSLHSAAS